MRLTELVAEIQKDFDADGVRCLVDLGKMRQADGAPARIIVVPTTFRDEAPREPGGNGQAIANTLQTLEVHVWAPLAAAVATGEEIESCLALRQDFCRSLFRLAEGSMEWGSGKFETAAHTDVYGCACTFTVQVRMTLAAEELMVSPAGTVAVNTWYLKNTTGETQVMP